MKVTVTNNRQAPYGVETAKGGYVFVSPGKVRTVDAVNLKALDLDGIGYEATGELPLPPASLVDKIAGKGVALPPADDTEKAAEADGIKKTPASRQGASRKAPTRRRGRRKAPSK